MKVITTIDAWQLWRHGVADGKTVGFVPTMGALHDGHRSLIVRNRRLSHRERQKAAHFPRLLATDAPVENIARLLKKDGFEVDYVQDFKGRRCAAIHCGGVRLIDNIPLPAGDGR